MPKLWSETIQSHRHAVGQAILETTWRLVHEQGLHAVTMSKVAEETGIGRATLYKYFPDVPSILHAWHDQHVAAHITKLTALGEHTSGAGRRLEVVLDAYARIARHRGGELGALLHQKNDTAPVERELIDLITGLLGDAAAAGEIRDDVNPRELSSFCLHALAASGSLDSDAAVGRLVQVTLAGLKAGTNNE